MNPETRVTNDQIRLLCKRHGIEYYSSSRITVGFSNELHGVNDDLILKVFLPESIRYSNELAVLSSILDFPKPSLVAASLPNSIIDRPYILMSRVSGTPLGHVWHLVPELKRNRLIREYIEMQRLIASSNIVKIDGISWYETLNQYFDEILDKLRNKKIIDQEKNAEIKKIVERHKSVLTGNLKPIFWDIHLDNVLVDKNFELSAFIDFEHIKLATVDFPLFALRRLVTEPARFATEENEKYAKVEDYKNIWGWYQELYPEMFSFEHLETRIKIYQLLDYLNLMKEWSHNEELQLILKCCIDELKITHIGIIKHE